MDNINKLLYQAFAILIFCLSINILFTLYKNYGDFLNVSSKILSEDIAFEQTNTLEKIIYTKGEIILMLLNKLDYDVQIDLILISKSENIKENITDFNILDKNYTKSYAYDNKGNITRIIFQSINLN